MTAVIFGRYVSAMAHHVITFLDALGPNQVDLLGFSLGGFVARQVVFERPDLVRRLILAGTGPQGGEGMQKRVCGGGVCFRNALPHVIRSLTGGRLIIKLSTKISMRLDHAVEAGARLQVFSHSLHAIDNDPDDSTPCLSSPVLGIYLA